MFKNNGINAADIARMERNFATEMVNSNTPACLSFSTTQPDNPPYFGEFISYKENNGGVITDVTSEYKSLVGIIKPSDARSNVISHANPYEDLRKIGKDPTELSGYLLSTNGGHSMLQLNTSVVFAVSPTVVSDETVTDIYYRVFGLDSDGIIKWTMISRANVPQETRTGGKIFIPMTITTGATVEQNDRLLFGMTIKNYKGEEFPGGSLIQCYRWNANLQLFVRKYTNTKP